LPLPEKIRFAQWRMTFMLSIGLIDTGHNTSGIARKHHHLKDGAQCARAL